MGGISISYDSQAQIQVYVEYPIYSPLCKKLLSPPKETYAGVQKNGRRTSNIQFLMATTDTRQYFGHITPGPSPTPGPGPDVQPAHDPD